MTCETGVIVCSRWIRDSGTVGIILGQAEFKFNSLISLQCRGLVI